MSCEMCEHAVQREAGEDPFAIARLSTGYVTLAATQYFRGYTFFIAKACVSEVFALPSDERATHLHEMTEVAHALYRAFNPRKMNYEALGNSVPHLHWHLAPRYDTDAQPRGPIWEDPEFMRIFMQRGTPPDEHSDESRRQILRELRAADVTIEREYLEA